MNKLLSKSFAAVLLGSFTASTLAASVAIKNVDVYTASSTGFLTAATVVFDDGKISAINPKVISADTTIDGSGKILTPGAIAPMTELGLVEVSAVHGSDDSHYKKADASFDPSVAFNPKSTLIPYARKGGITSTLVAPLGGDSSFKGQLFIANLSAKFDSVRASKSALYMSIGEKEAGSRAVDIQALTNALLDAEYQLKNPKKDKKTKPSEQTATDLMAAVAKGAMPLVISVDRAADMLQLLKLKKQFNVNLVFQDAADAPLIAKQLAEAEVPLIISAMNNLPESFSSLNNHLSNAGILEKAGVTVMLQNIDSHNMYQLRFDVGNAVANGLARETAWNTVSSNVAKVFGLESGSIAVGRRADLALWSGDPLEFSSRVEQLWIDGQEYSTESRQDKLRKRYTTASPMPAAYR